MQNFGELCCLLENCGLFAWLLSVLDRGGDYQQRKNGEEHSNTNAKPSTHETMETIVPYRNRQVQFEIKSSLDPYRPNLGQFADPALKISLGTALTEARAGGNFSVIFHTYLS